MNRRSDNIELLSGSSAGLDRPAASEKAPRASEKRGKRDAPGFADTLGGQLLPPGAAPAPAAPSDPARRPSVGKARASQATIRTGDAPLARRAAAAAALPPSARPTAAGRMAPERSAPRQDSSTRPSGDGSTAAPALSAPPAPALEDRHATLEPVRAPAAPPPASLSGERGPEGAVLPHSAHLRVESEALGQVELHVRVREGVAHVRLEGPTAEAAQRQLPELRSALAREGLTLGDVEVTPASAAPAAPAQAATGGGVGPNGDDDPAAVEPRRDRERDGRRRVLNVKA